MNIFHLKSLSVKAALSAALLFIATTTNAAIITFGNGDLDRIDLAGAQTEAGFSYSTTDDAWEVQSLYGNPGSALVTFFNGEDSDVGDSISFTSASNSLFSFTSIDWRSITADGGNDHVIIEGFFNGGLVNSLAISGTSTTFTTLAGFGGVLDELVIRMTFDGNNALVFDNLNLSTTSAPIPEPHMFMLFAAGLIVLARRRLIN